ncbi:MAG: hypothetical protein J0H01_30710 [Rhizobiales bacterium]|nr:hypothetical protein [Hyphomicrobiales bacterium]
MKVEVTHHVDASDADENGHHDYHYEYDIYRFSNGLDEYVARSYIDAPQEAHFLSRVRLSRAILLRPEDLKTALFAAAAAHLRAAGKARLQWLSEETGGYLPLDNG